MEDKRPQRPKAVPRKVRVRAKRATLGPTSAVANAGRAAGQAQAAQAPVRKSTRRVIRTPIGKEFGKHGTPKAITGARDRKATETRRQAVKTQRAVLPSFPTLKKYTPQQGATIREAHRKVVDQLGKGKYFVDRTKAEANAVETERQLQQTHSERVLAPYRRVGALKVDTAPYRKPLTLNTGGSENLKANAAKILEQTTRPTHAIAGSAKAAIEGTSVPKAALRGFKNEDKTTFSDVLKSAGVKNKYVTAIGGLTLDVITDPTTVATGGANVPAKFAVKAGAKAEKKALKQGLNKSQAQNFRKMAERQAAKDNTRGVTIGARGRVPFTDVGFDVKTSGAATAAIGRKLKSTKAGQKAAQGNAKARDVLNETVAPDVTPSYRTRTEHAAIRDAERTHRAKVASGERKAVRRSKAYHKAVSEEEAAQVRTAIERKTVDQLPPRLEQVAHAYRADFEKELAAKTSRGLGMKFTPDSPKDAQAFFPRALENTKDTVPGQPAKRPVSDRRRKVRLPFDEAKGVVKENTYVEDARQAASLKSLQANRSVSLHDLWEKVAKDAGRPLTPTAKIADGEAVYEIVPKQGPRLVADASEGDRIAKIADRAGYMILNKKSVESILARQPARGTHKVTRAYDKVQGQVKKFQTIYRPGYHVINLVGDSSNAWLADTGAKSFGQSRRALKAQRALTKFERSPEAVTTPGKKAAKAEKELTREVKVGKAGKMTLGDLLKLADEHGAINTGQISHEIRGLVGGAGTKAGRREHKFSEWRENIPRLATFREGLARGMSAEQAAKHSLKAHIDYSDLTSFERKYFRRAFQFYTFYARNSRIQATKLVTRPGKFATVQKGLEEASKAAGFGSYTDYVGQLPDYNQRGLPVPVRVGSAVYPVFLQPPTTDLQSLSPHLTEQFQNVASRLTTFKTIPELVANYSIFFQGQIQNPKQPLVIAPEWVAHLPGFVKKRLGVVPDFLDKRSGKTTWGWHAKADYAFRALPQSNLGVSLAKPGQDNRSLNGALALMPYFVGPKIGPDKRQDYKVNRVYDDLVKVQNRLGELNQRGVYIDGRPISKSAEKLVPEYKRLNERKKQLERDVRKLRVDRGDKVLPKAGASKDTTGWGGVTGSGGGGTPGGWGDTTKRSQGTPGGWGSVK